MPVSLVQAEQLEGKSDPQHPPHGLLKKEHRSVVDCGMSVSWLVSWAATVKDRLGPDATTAEVCAKVVIPDTSA